MAASPIFARTRSTPTSKDNWQKNAKLTFNLGLRYELVLPYVEVNGQMANLDAAPGFTAAAPVVSGGADRSPADSLRDC